MILKCSALFLIAIQMFFLHVFFLKQLIFQ